MSRFRTLAAGATFLFGTTFLWFLPSSLETGTAVEGASWSVIQLLVPASVIGYAGVAWGLYKATAWWRPLTIAGSIVGTVVLLWSMAVGSLSGVTNMAANLALHAIGIAVLLLALLVPSLRRDLKCRLAGHRGAMR